MLKIHFGVGMTTESEVNQIGVFEYAWENHFIECLLQIVNSICNKYPHPEDWEPFETIDIDAYELYSSCHAWQHALLIKQRDLKNKHPSQKDLKIEDSETFEIINIEFILENPYDNWDYKQICLTYDINPSLLINYPMVPWDYFTLTSKLPRDFVLTHLNKPWNLRLLFDDDISEIIKTIRKYPDVNWNFEDLSRLDFPLEFIKQFPYAKWNYKLICLHNHTITVDFMRLNPKFPWDFMSLCENTCIPVEYFLKVPDITFASIVKRNDFDYVHIFNNSCLCNKLYEDIYTYAEVLSKRWPVFDWYTIITDLHYGVQYHVPIIESDIVSTIRTNQQLGIPINFHILTMSIRDILENPDIEWDMRVLNIEDLTMQIVLANPELDWNMYKISKMNGLKVEDVLNNPDLDWHYDAIVLNKSIRITDIISTMDQIEWDLSNIGLRDDLTFDHILQMMDKGFYAFNCRLLEKNDFDNLHKRFIQEQSKIHFVYFTQEINCKLQDNLATNCTVLSKAFDPLTIGDLVRYVNEFI